MADELKRKERATTGWTLILSAEDQARLAHNILACAAALSHSTEGGRG